jgi:hypothetical protein
VKARLRQCSGRTHDAAASSTKAQLLKARESSADIQRGVVVRVWHLLLGGLAIAALAAGGAWALSGWAKSTDASNTGGPKAQAQSKQTALEAAQSNVRAAVPAIGAYHWEHSTYVGVTARKLRVTYDYGLSPTLTVGWARRQSYCLQSTVAGRTASFLGPRGPVRRGRC